MQTFDTPEPLSLQVKTTAGQIAVEATERVDTAVEVLPADPHNHKDVDAAERTRIEHRDGSIHVETPKDQGQGRAPEVNVRVALPQGSAVKIDTVSADVRISGQTGAVQHHSASGGVHVDHAREVSARTASGDVQCHTVEADAQISVASGDITLDVVRGSAKVTSASGDILIREVHGDVKVQAASGDARVGTAHGSVKANTASGDLRIDSVVDGHTSANSASGDITIGVAEGTAAWLQLASLSGRIQSGLDSTEHPGTDQTVNVRANTVSGDITITRAG